MKWSHLVTILAILGLIWASLFITILDQVSHLNKLATQNQQLAITTQQLSQQNKQLLQAIQQGNDGIHSQINCVLNFFTQSPTARTNSSITNPQACIISPSSSGGATGGTKSQ